MNITSRIATILILTFMVLMLLGCNSSKFTTLPEFSPTADFIESSNPAYAAAQATIDSGQSQLLDLSHKATEVSLTLSQAANAAAQSTKDYSQRQKMDLDYQATNISLSITQAAATQEFITQQTQMARDASAVAQSSADAATQSAYLVNVTQTAQAQAILDAQAIQTAQAVAALTSYPLTATYSAQSLNATQTVQALLILNVQADQDAQAIASLTAYPLTATPLAATQAAVLMQEYSKEQQSFVDRVVTPLVPIVATLVLLLFVLVIVLASRRVIPMPWPRRLSTARGNADSSPMIMIDGVAADYDPRLHDVIPSEPAPANPPRPASENTVHVEIVNATEPPVAHWIAEVEHQLATEGELKL